MKHAEWNREVMNHATIVYQRRHRKWALKRARGGLLLQNGVYVLSDLWEKRAHKAEAEVRRQIEWSLGMQAGWVEKSAKAEAANAKLVEALENDVEHESGMASMHHRHLEEVRELGKKWRQRIQELEIGRKQLQADKAKLVEALKEIIEDDSTWAHIQNKCYAAIEGVS